jgi:hypothetical protein
LNDLADIGGPLGPAAPRAQARRLDGGYEVRISRRGDALSATVVSHRAPGALRVAEGRAAPEAAGLAGLLFPINATAQTAAALSAAEGALKVALTPAQVAARRLLVGFETASACAWRMGLAWSQLTGGLAHAEIVREARDAAAAAVGAIYENGDWARIGGGAIRPRPAELLEQTNAMRHALRLLAPMFDDIAPDAPAIGDIEARTWPLLDETGIERAATALSEDAGFAARPHLSGRAVEESPRAILGRSEITEGLATWFRAQAEFAAGLPDRLERALRDVRESDPASVNLKGSGKGWGIAVTARGRIIHWMSIERGKVRAWRAIEPTDWNFAPKGPVARAAELLSPDADLADAGRWIVAAFDPSAPCRVIVDEGA